MVQYGFKTLIMVDFLGNSKDDTHHKKETSASSAKEATSLPTNRFFGNVNVAGSTFPNLCRSSWHLQKPNKPSTEEKNDDRNHGCFFPGKWMVPKKNGHLLYTVQQNLMASTTFIMNLWRGVQRASMENYRGFCKCINKSCHKSHISGSADLLWSLVLISCLLWIHRSASWSFIKSAESASYRMASDHKPFSPSNHPSLEKGMTKNTQKNLRFFSDWWFD